MSWISVLSDGLQKKILKEMADPRKKVLHYVDTKCDSVREHFLKAIVFKDTMNNLDGWETTLANILNYCNGLLIKSNNGKLKEKEYFEYLFGITDTFDIHDAEMMVKGFELDFGGRFPPFKKSTSLYKEVYTKYKELSHYFSKFLHDDSGKVDRMHEFKEKVVDIINGGAY